MRPSCRPAAALLLASLTPVAARANPPVDPPSLTGLYGGSHVCENGEHGALLEITRVIAADTPDYPFRLEGCYAFFPVIGVRSAVDGDMAGSFLLVGEIREDGRVTLDNLGWLVAPPKAMVPLISRAGLPCARTG